VLPNIDLIKEIYTLKEDLELVDTKEYYGVCPIYVQPITRNVYQIDHLHKSMLLNALVIKLIQEKGFICTFYMEEEDYTDEELNEIHLGNWISVIPNIDYNPSLRTRIKIMNIIYYSIVCFVEDLYIRLNDLHNIYINNDDANIFRIGYDHNGVLYIPSSHA